MPTPSQRKIKQQIKKLRDLIESKDSDPLQSRLAQIIEEALQWATISTDWDDPIKSVPQWAKIFREDRELMEIASVITRFK